MSDLRSRFLGLLADKGIDQETRLRVVDSLVTAAEIEFGTRVDKFVEATDALAGAYYEKARESKIWGVEQYREGKADGLAQAAARANRMKINEQDNGDIDRWSRIGYQAGSRG